MFVCVKGQKGGWRAIRRAALFVEINLAMNGSRLDEMNKQCNHFIFVKHKKNAANSFSMKHDGYAHVSARVLFKIQIGRFNYESFQVLIYHYATNIAILNNIITFSNPLIISGESYVEFKFVCFFRHPNIMMRAFSLGIKNIEDFASEIGMKRQVKTAQWKKFNAFSFDFDFFPT